MSILLIKKFIQRTDESKHYQATFYLLLLTMLGLAIENLTWILELSYKIDLLLINYKNIQILSMIAWSFTLVRYQSLALFVENLIENKFTFRWHQKIILCMNTCLTILYIDTAIRHIYNIPSLVSIHLMYRVAPFYFVSIIIPSIIIVAVKLHHKKIPAILKKQLTIFLKYILFPHFLFELLQAIPFFGPQGAHANIAGIIGALSLLFMTIAIVFCTVNLIRFRIFNFSEKVQDQSSNYLTGNFKHSIESLSLATSRQELIFITQNFFKENFGVAFENICLNFRYKQELCVTGIDAYCSMTSNTIESFINNNDQSIALLREYKILVADEIMFDAYYTTNPHQIKLADFLNNIESEIFLPMYDKNNIIAYLTVKRNGQHKFYSLTEQNKIVIFGAYLASAINILHNSNTATLVQENKKVKEELYLKHQEINQYKESIKTLIKQKSNASVGILFYKDNRFTLGNETAQNILSINLNQQRNHPATITITKLAQQVSSYRTAQSCFLYDHNNKQIVVTGVPHLDYQGGVILTIYYPDTSDIIKKQIEKLQDPSQIDYLLYLETTKSGKLINQIIPSNHEELLHFKIKLLEIALSKKATLLQSHPDDLLSIVEIIHDISLRHTLHIIDLKPTISTHDLKFKLFGLNPLLMQDSEEALLQKLHGTGTLFIKNIELLDLETQNKLAEFIRYGVFTICKSEQRVTSDVRIICSMSQNIQTLLDQNKLSTNLFKELAQTNLQMPSLITMEKNQLDDLIDGFSHQAIESSSFSNLLQISKKDKENLIDNRPASLREFKSKIKHLLTQKSKDNHIFHETHFDPEFNITNPKLLKAANLGKHALKDAEMMSMLWNQFQCQNKIAQFLGVNRSSVQRRCKEYNLL